MSVRHPSFLRLFVGGFVAGVLGLTALQPAEATRTLNQYFHISATK